MVAIESRAFETDVVSTVALNATAELFDQLKIAIQQQLAETGRKPNRTHLIDGD